MIPDDEKIMEIQDEIQGMDYTIAKAEFPVTTLDEFFDKFGFLAPTSAENVVDLDSSDIEFQFEFADEDSIADAKDAVINEIYCSMPDWAQLGVITDDYRLLPLPLFKEIRAEDDFIQIVSPLEIGEHLDECFPKSIDNIFTAEKTINDSGKVILKDGYYTMNVLGSVNGEEYAKSIINFNKTRVDAIYKSADTKTEKQMKNYLKSQVQNGKSKSDKIKE